MRKRVVYGGLILVLGVNLFWGARIYLASAQAAEKSAVYEQMFLFTSVLEKVREDYVDGDKTTYQDLIYGALKGMLNTLDPHSEFMEPIKYDELRKDTEGVFGGVGIVIGVRDNYLTVISPMEDTPAFRAGVLPGDRIVRIEGKISEKLNIQDAVKILRGQPGTEVTLTIQRPPGNQLREIQLTRAVIKVDTVKDMNGKRDFPLGDNGIGYVRLTQFNEPTTDDLEKALRKLETQGMKALILDLRNNPGGLLAQAVEVCGKFLPRGTLIVTTEGRMQPRKIPYRAEGARHPDYPMVVLVNSGSASASEIVAGCLQDVKPQRAIIVGEQTFGKGSVQSILPLSDGSALRLTTAKYYTPSHKVIHEKGITPDIVIPMSPEDEEALYLKRSPSGADAIEGLDEKRRESIQNTQDAQLDRAMDLLKGILLYTRHAPVTTRVAVAR